jgi:Holliday junction DNA helicase RuvA
MIGWLQGRPMECWTQGNRSGVLLLCGGVGYEVHLTERHQHNLPADGDLNLWIHQVQREDGSSLYGFPLRQERDCKPQELVEAISSGDLRRLCKAQGIGKRTAERLAVELRASIAAFAGVDPAPSLAEGISSEQMPASGADVEATLSMLGYDDLEIRRAIRAIAEGADGEPPAGDDQDAWLRVCLQWLSRESA